MKTSFVRSLIVVTVLLNCFTWISAEEVKLNDILKNLEQNDKTLTSVKFNYEQEISYTLTNELQHNSGQMIFARPNGFYFKQNNPLEQIIVSNGKKVWIYTPSYKQVIVDVWARWINSGIIPNSTLSLNLSWSELGKKYSFEYLGQEEGSHVLLLLPLKTPNNSGQNALNNWKMKLWIDIKDFKPLRTDLIGENVKVITRIKEYTRNGQVDGKIFNFKAPEGVEVMKMK